ncbi:uncharacterized protein LOC108909937 [Anoplophora glabripennis]|uniref:uncharacterized protein LOC108909937 n=1 Tax=Anoplophora glabripennis TaxID=217634 RepID=UPI0008746AF0|nr:uncharacterized protein LOC108909937 [Anoplophora glabripennis]
MDEVEDTIFNSDPIYMMHLVGKEVELITIENVTHIGTVYVIDPIYKTTVLHTNRKSFDEYETVFVLYHAIKSVKILSDKADESYLKSVEPKSFEDKDIKKNVLKKWLEHMFINVVESGDYLKIDDHLVIVPPYGSDNCICNNTIILDRIQKIISLMPPDFK